ncbi:MAG: hypothetical protein ABI839_06505 [Verrucomicrobiota bacterium]
MTISLGFLVSTAQAQTPDNVVARGVADADIAYAQVALANGMPTASLRYFAVDGVAFAPRAVNGKKYWAAHEKDFKGDLIWSPVFATAAHAGDLACTTGPWELKRDGQSVAFGNYVTVWSKESAGDWKVVLDVGTENPQPTNPPASLQLMPPDATAGERLLEDVRRRLLKRERAFLAASRKDAGAAALASADDEIRVFRENALPAVGLAAARLLLGTEHLNLRHEYGGGKMSSSGDLSYSYGNYSVERGNTTERGIYLDLWRLNLNGDWQLILDLQKKIADS